MKMGIKEFRERLGEIAQGEAVVELTKHGKVVGQYRPKRTFDPVAAEKAVNDISRWQAELRAKGVEPEDLLAELGLDPWGVPLDDRA